MIAGARRPQQSEVLHVDYKVVLDQAVENARLDALRKALAAVYRIKLDREYGEPANVKNQAIRNIEALL